MIMNKSVPPFHGVSPSALILFFPVPKLNSVATGKSSNALIVHPQDAEMLLRSLPHTPSPPCHTREFRRACFHASTPSSLLYTALVHHHILATSPFLATTQRFAASVFFLVRGFSRPIAAPFFHAGNAHFETLVDPADPVDRAHLAIPVHRLAAGN